MSRPLALALSLQVVAISSGLLSFIACSTPAPAPEGNGTSSSGFGGTPDAASPTGTSSSGSLVSSGSSGTSGTDAGDVDSRCLAPDAGGCGNCCTTVHATGSKAYDSILLKCLCTTPAACQTECATTMCASPPTGPNQTCDTCVRASLANGGACIRQVTVDCAAAPDCPELNACIDKCG
jgi:hypothetical protein